MRAASIAILAGSFVLPAVALAGATPMLPGLWEIAVKVERMTMAGGPPGVADMMRGKTTTIRHCLTAAEAAQGPQEMIKADKSCKFTRYATAGRTFTSEIVCTQGDATLTSSGTGTYAPGSFTATSHTVGTGRMAMTMDATTTGRRVGACDRSGQ